MNKDRRNELRDLRWKRRLKKFGYLPGASTICWRDQAKPCSCRMCKRGPNRKYTIKYYGEGDL